MKLYLGGYYSFYTHEKNRWMDIHLEQPTPLSEIINRLGIPTAEVFLTVLNGEVVELEQTMVSDPDEVKLFPDISGGREWQG